MMRYLFAAMLLSASLPLQAHDLGVARVLMIAQPDHGWRIEAKLPENIPIRPPVLPADCEQTRQTSAPLPRKNRLDSWTFGCARPADEHAVVEFPWQREGIFVTIRWQDGREDGRFYRAVAGTTSVPLGETGDVARGVGEVLFHYTILGIEHILLGWDHLAFVLCLCLLARRWQLVKLVTAFTLGHSLTLALAVLGWVQVPILPVEACIALSIAFVAREALRPDSRLRHGYGLVFAFGLLHGLGFASALLENGIGRGELLPGLVAFNLGVEVGQLLFIVCVLAFTRLARGLTDLRRARSAAAFGLGTLAVFWTLERVASFGAWGLPS